MQRWEYKVETVWGDAPDLLPGQLNNFGIDGWELVTIYRNDGWFYGVFKRQKEY